MQAAPDLKKLGMGFIIPRDRKGKIRLEVCCSGLHEVVLACQASLFEAPACNREIGATFQPNALRVCAC